MERSRNTTSVGIRLDTNDTAPRQAEQYTEDIYGWYDMFQIYKAYDANHNAAAKEHCDKMMKLAKSRKNCQKKFRKDPNFKQYRLLKESIEGAKDSAIRKRGLQMEAEVDPSQASR